jgi:hypothetical protein
MRHFYSLFFAFVLIALFIPKGFTAIDTGLLKQFAGLYPQLFRSAFTPVSYMPTASGSPDTQSQLMSQLLLSYRDQTHFEDLSLALETPSGNVLKSDAEITEMMSSIGLGKADYDMLMYQLSENPAVLKQFFGYLQANGSLQKLAELKQELPSYGQLLPTKEHRKVFFEILELSKSPQQQLPNFEAKPVVKPSGQSLPVKQPFSSMVWFADPTS